MIGLSGWSPINPCPIMVKGPENGLCTRKRERFRTERGGVLERPIPIKTEKGLDECTDPTSDP
jgi:hypothetical protein